MSAQESQYERAVTEYGPALVRLARGYESDFEKRRDLLQEIHLALWRSFHAYEERCSLRTWVYRVAHNTAATWIIREKRLRPETLVSIDELDAFPVEPSMDRTMALNRLTALIHKLKPLDRQVILAWLEGVDAAGISELTGLTPGNAATRIHRIKNLLALSFKEGEFHAK